MIPDAAHIADGELVGWAHFAAFLAAVPSFTAQTPRRPPHIVHDGGHYFAGTVHVAEGLLATRFISYRPPLHGMRFFPNLARCLPLCCCLCRLSQLRPFFFGPLGGRQARPLSPRLIDDGFSFLLCICFLSFFFLALRIECPRPIAK